MRFKRKKSKTFNINHFIGKQLARLRFGVTYIQMVYYASVILGAIVLIANNIFGPGIIGWLDSLIILIVIFVIEWGLGYYTEKKGIVIKDRYQGMVQNIPAQKMITKELWKEIVIPLQEEMFERALTKTLNNLNIPNKQDIIEEIKQSIIEE